MWGLECVVKIFTLRNVLRTAMWGGIAALGTALVGVIVAAVYVVRVTADLPDYQ